MASKLLKDLNIDTASKLLKDDGEDEYRKKDGLLGELLANAQANIQSRDDIVNFMTSDKWNNHLQQEKKRSSELREEVEEDGGKSSKPTKTCITFIDEKSNDNEECKMYIDNRQRLKTLFNDYADRRGQSSVRSFRFTYEGQTLFLSMIGKKSAYDLGILEEGIITVTNLVIDEKTDKDEEKRNKEAYSKQKKSSSSQKKSKGKQKKKKKKKRVSHHPQVMEKSEEDFKVEHSKSLGKVHDEAQLHLKLIRQRLNNLVLERSKPKSKKKVEKLLRPSQVYNPSSECIGGKAGKTHYTIQVGEVSNLYKTSKHHKDKKSHTQVKTLKIDLHGLTKQESLKSLNESLPIWYERAMSGSHPFVIPVEIICGAGSQVLSEVVEQWIKCNDQVANAPKNRKM